MGNTKTHQQAEARKQARIDNDMRVAAWRLLPADQQLAILDSRLGVNIGAKRQRGKLANGK